MSWNHQTGEDTTGTIPANPSTITSPSHTPAFRQRRAGLKPNKQTNNQKTTDSLPALFGMWEFIYSRRDCGAGAERQMLEVEASDTARALSATAVWVTPAAFWCKCRERRKTSCRALAKPSPSHTAAMAVWRSTGWLRRQPFVSKYSAFIH